MGKINLFISYSHQEKDQYLPELLTYLNEENCPKIKIWYDDNISPGREWDEIIKNSLNNAEIVILLLSQAFLMSRYIRENELRNAIDQHNMGTCKVVPIFIRKCILENYPEIKKLQGLPKEMLFISDMGEERWGHYAEITQKLNDIAGELETEKNILNSKNTKQNTSQSIAAKKIEELRNNKKIFLALPANEEAKKKRKQFLYQVEGKIKYENWPYEITPGIESVDEIFKSEEGDREKILSSFIKEAIYSIHLISSENDLVEGVDKLQYELAKNYRSTSNCSKSIIWVLNADIRERLDKDVSMNPMVCGGDYETLFDLIKSLDDEKEKLINELKKPFSPDKKVFMFYDFSKDHDSELRINLKTKIEENKNLLVKFSVPNASFERDKEDLATCDGGCIFYGATDAQWFAMRQSILIDSGYAHSKAICLDEPEIERKADRDVSKNAFITIKGKKGLDFGVKSFIDRL